MTKLKIFPLMISKQFMATHPRRGEPTHFREKIELGQNRQQVTATDVVSAFHSGEGIKGWVPKIHTIRTNYEYWARIAEEVNAGRGILSLRQWSGSPYNFKRDGSRPVEFLRLEKMGVQKISIEIYKEKVSFDDKLHPQILKIKLPEIRKYGSIPIAPNLQVPDRHIEFARLICKNDGLNDYEFKHWFKKDTEGAILHFTSFRY